MKKIFENWHLFLEAVDIYAPKTKEEALAILNLDSNKKHTAKEIKDAFRDAARRTHTDYTGDNKAEAFKRAKAAYDMLGSGKEGYTPTQPRPQSSTQKGSQTSDSRSETRPKATSKSTLEAFRRETSHGRLFDYLRRLYFNELSEMGQDPRIATRIIRDINTGKYQPESVYLDRTHSQDNINKMQELANQLKYLLRDGRYQTRRPPESDFQDKRTITNNVFHLAYMVLLDAYNTGRVGENRQWAYDTLTRMHSKGVPDFRQITKEPKKSKKKGGIFSRMFGK